MTNARSKLNRTRIKMNSMMTIWTNGMSSTRRKTISIMTTRVVILGFRRLMEGHNGRVGGRASPLHQVQNGRIGHIL
jgi:hypothetical protein